MEKFRIIINDISRKIENGKLRPGKRVPSIRALAEQFSCSNGTAIKALEHLQQQHLVYSKPKSGYYVIESGKPEEDLPSPIIFASTSFPDIQYFPYENFQHCMIQAINTYKKNLFTYTDPKGLPALRQTIKSHLEDPQIFSRLDRVFITTGSQQAIDLLSKMPFPNGGTTVLTEQPTYFGALKAFSLNHVPTLGITRNFDGLDLNVLEDHFRKHSLKFFYTTPRLHNPIGHSYTRKEMKSIVFLAKKYNVYILEDDYMADFIDPSKSLPIYAYDRDDMVINTKSFSKILLPGLRLSSLVLPAALIETFSDYKKWADVNSTIISQGTLEIFIKSGMFTSYSTMIKQLYSRRMKHLITVLENTVDTELMQYSTPAGGYFLAIHVPLGTDYDRIMNRLENKNIRLVDIRVCMLKNDIRSHYFRLSVSKMDGRAIDIAVPEIVRVIQKNILARSTNPEKPIL